MALPSSGAISLANIQTEFGGSNPVSLSEYYRGGTYVPSWPSVNASIPASGAISLNQFYGTAREFLFVVGANTSNLSLRNACIAAGWDQDRPVRVVINPGVFVSGSAGSSALYVAGTFPKGLYLINQGTICGYGGVGGSANGGAGASGYYGLLIATATPMTIDNGSGVIAGGGGGGGAGGGYTYLTGGKESYYVTNPGSGGGGGWTGHVNSAGGTGAANGSPGTSTGAGAGGAGMNSAGYGGGGGARGAAGAAGQSVSSAGGAGGAGGGAIAGNSQISWVSFGTRLGAIT